MPNNTLLENSKTDDIYLSKNEKINIIEEHMEKILLTLGLDLEDPSIRDTPKRVAKMYVTELFSGLLPTNFPKLTFIPISSSFTKDRMILTKNILVQSICEHHFLPMTGIAHVAYIPTKKIIGLSKLNRLVEYFSKRPQIQERLTHQVCECISNVLDTPDVAVYFELTHFCMQFRGVKDPSSKTITSEFFGKFQSEQALQDEFYLKSSR